MCMHTTLTGVWSEADGGLPTRSACRVRDTPVRPTRWKDHSTGPVHGGGHVCCQEGQVQGTQVTVYMKELLPALNACERESRLVQPLHTACTILLPPLPSLSFPPFSSLLPSLLLPPLASDSVRRLFSILPPPPVTYLKLQLHASFFSGTPLSDPRAGPGAGGGPDHTPSLPQ